MDKDTLINVAAKMVRGGELAHLADQQLDDDRLVELWLHGRSLHTQRCYRLDVNRFRAFTQKPLALASLQDLQQFSDSFTTLSPRSLARVLSSVKSLLAFGHKIGYLQYDVGRVLRVPTAKDTLTERILPEADVLQMIALEPNKRNRGLIRLLYAAGLRVSEVCGLKWRDVQPRADAGQITVYGKGSKTRTILLSSTTWRELIGLKGEATPDQPVFLSRFKRQFDTSMVYLIVRAAAKRAGIEGNVSPHWLRHAHASHALDRGAPIHLVQATLGHESIATTGRYLHARPTDSSARFLPV